MGCASSSAAMDAIMDQPVKKVDERLPFDHYRQLFNWRNTWKAITRSMEATSVDMFIRLFKRYPEYQQLHKDLKDIKDEEVQRTSLSFEIAAMAVFTLIDDMVTVIEDADQAIDLLNEAGAKHAKIDGFKARYFRHMKKPWMEAIHACLEDRFNENARQNADRVFDFIIEHMTSGFLDTKGDDYEETEDEESDDDEEENQTEKTEGAVETSEAKSLESKLDNKDSEGNQNYSKDKTEQDEIKTDENKNEEKVEEKKADEITNINNEEKEDVIVKTDTNIKEEESDSKTNDVNIKQVDKS